MNGLIAFFDILGYQSFLENNRNIKPQNSAINTAERVLQLITDIPNQVRNEMTTMWSEHAKKRPEVIPKEVPEALTHLIFSDTIVLSIEYPKDSKDEWKNAALLNLVCSSTKLCKSMFYQGLPLRGAIVEGEFIVKNSCFAGQAIIDAYKLSSCLNLSGVALDKHLFEKFSKYFDEVFF
jgi:hypothetical protein